MICSGAPLLAELSIIPPFALITVQVGVFGSFFGVWFVFFVFSFLGTGNSFASCDEVNS